MLRSALAVALTMVVLHWAIPAFMIPSGAMSPTLVRGDRIFVSRISYLRGLPRHGDIIAFRAPPWADLQQRVFIKRVVGLPGDRIGVRGGHVYCNGQVLDEPYLADAPDYQWPTERVALLKEFGEPRPLVRDGEITVPQDMLVVLGDNRNENSDSHSWMAAGRDGKLYSCPFVPRERLVGRAFAVLWPPEHARWVSR